MGGVAFKPVSAANYLWINISDGRIFGASGARAIRCPFPAPFQASNFPCKRFGGSVLPRLARGGREEAVFFSRGIAKQTVLKRLGCGCCESARAPPWLPSASVKGKITRWKQGANKLPLDRDGGISLGDPLQRGSVIHSNLAVQARQGWPWL